MPRYAVRFYYDGRGYHGFQSQLAERAVASEILSALKRSKLIVASKVARFQAASRTDRGASALAQTVAFTTEGRFSTSRVNAFLPLDIAAWAWAEVPEGFNPRREAAGREYVYLHYSRGEDFEAMSAAARLLMGNHDFRNFTMGRVSCLRTLEELTVEREDGFILFRFFSKGFARGMVRKMVAVLLEIGGGRGQIGLVSRLLDPSYQPQRAIPPAPAENLLLLDVRYPNVEFKVEKKSLGRLLRGLTDGATVGRLKEVCLKKLAGVCL